MSFRRKLKYYLVHHHAFTNKKAAELIQNGAVRVNGQVVSTDVEIDETSEILLQQKVMQKRKHFRYFRFNKPPGVESTFSKKTEHNLQPYFQDHNGLFVAGRLDKASEGLLLLSDDGKWVEQICHPDSFKEKEYLVELDVAVDDAFVRRFAGGVLIGGGMTRPCFCEKTEEKKIRVILSEGKNRQIRRMCHKLGARVLKLTRIRIENHQLDGLKPGEFSTIIIK